MLALSDKLTSKQVQTLAKISITTPFELITFFPRDVIQVQSFFDFQLQFQPDYRERFVYTGVLENIDQRRGKRPFLVLHFSGQKSLSAYLFTVARYTLSSLKPGQQYQLLLSFRNGFWTVEKYLAFQPNKQSFGFQLGKMDPHASALLPVYSKVGVVQPGFFPLIHRRLQPQDYVLDFRGLVPPSQDILPEILNTARIHHPSSVADFEQAVRQWISLKVFLRLLVLDYVNGTQTQSYARAGQLPLSFLKDISSSLPFPLSQSQKAAIWGIVQDVCIYSAG